METALLETSLKVQLPIGDQSPSKAHYEQILEHTLQKVLEKQLPLENEAQLKKHLPLFQLSHQPETPGPLTLWLLAPCREDLFKFFFNLVSLWLVPGKRTNVINFYACDFHLPEITTEKLTLCDLTIQIDNEKDLKAAKENLPLIESEACSGAKSTSSAKSIMSIKGLGSEEKIALVHKQISQLIKDQSQHFNNNLYRVMQQLLLASDDRFKNNRSARHLCRLITQFYLFSRELRRHPLPSPKRFCLIRFNRTSLISHQSNLNVLGITLALSFSNDKEVFDKRHFQQAIEDILPQLKPVEGSYISRFLKDELQGYYYIEVCKDNNEHFRSDEIRLLTAKLHLSIKNRIEQHLSPLFMPRNDEELMRNMLTLGSQLRYCSDLPQLTIQFSEQTRAELSFSIILARVLKPQSPTLPSLLKKSPLNISYDLKKKLGMLRKKYPKEAHVFHINIAKAPFIRLDGSLDLHRARLFIHDELLKLIGEFRDFNGGMIAKQQGVFKQLSSELENHSQYDPLLLEKLFFSLQPNFVIPILDSPPLKKLYELVLEAQNSNSPLPYFKHIHEEQHLYLVEKNDTPPSATVIENIKALQLPSAALATARFSLADHHYFVLIAAHINKQTQKQICQCYLKG